MKTSKTQWFYVIYRDYPGSKPYLSSKHLSMEAAKKAMESKLKDPFWRGYTWSVITEKPIYGLEEYRK